ncbi:hydantoinase/oxoprolinase family protein [Bacillus sp. FJAT-29790]|uniref:hydantoinase/oxoprolinase family protein n=1 Tax=Bacillus sp. FJAT-29790 TaxID=1895002 RepID=UPI001C2347BC|nr:hydantoinase/oxoprolinase family protein [Bacillus sp. FJAT-29790]MBU8877525.1 hydantoinase/oxoprolinase family protein [Bacillus sp. FJAT-29790]
MNSIELLNNVRVGIDTGGTFTDCVLWKDEKPLIVIKVPSTPSNPAEAIMNGLERLCDIAGIQVQNVRLLAHGTTVATNAMLQEQWAKVGLITTKGFRDVLEIGTQMRPELYGLQQRKSAPIVPRNLRMEVAERIDPEGRVVEKINREEVQEVIKEIIAGEIESLAVSFLFSYANPEHEAAIREAAAELAPDLYLCISSEVSPEFREYPRTSTTVINAALAPVVRRYIRNLRQELDVKGIGNKLNIMQSNGGIVSGEEAEMSSHNLILSGPAAGMVAAAEIAQKSNFPNALTFDMGGTSSDIGIIIDGKPQVVQGTTVNNTYPLQVPTVDIHTIGAGGGSIGWKDQGGALKVGPKSAGAVPGPACYGLGGVDPTVTDANLFLGRLDPENYLGGEFTVYPDLSFESLKKLANELDLDVERVASGILEVANANMAGALRVVSSRRGYDPRDFALIAYGGAGPLHATALARELGIKRVIIPASPGVLCAKGLLLSDVRHDFTHTEVVSIEYADLVKLEESFIELENRGINRLDKEGVPSNKIRLKRTLDIRYKGQEYYLNIPIDGRITPQQLKEVTDLFHEVHRSTYGHAATNEPVEIVNLRLSAIGEIDRLENEQCFEAMDLNSIMPTNYRSVFFNGYGWMDTPIYRREDFNLNTRIEGPAIIVQMDTTVIIEPKQNVTTDEQGNLIVLLEGIE